MTAVEPFPALRILYVDDDPALGRLVERQLGRRGFSVTHAGDGEQGLRLLDQTGFDAVGLDHFMPGRTGIQLLDDIRLRPDAPPVIIVTGADEGRIAVAALKAGAADYVIKDVDGAFVDLFETAVVQAVQQRRLERDKERAEREMREARERAEILLREVNHRVANSLQLVASLVTMQQKTAGLDPAARGALVEAHNRIHAIAQVHRRLYTSDDVRFVALDAYLQGLVEELEAAMKASGRAHDILVSAQPVRVATDKAVSLGVIVTELVTNAFKYAYPEGVRGTIRIRLVRENSLCRLEVEDDGVGWTGAGKPQGSGLGTRIVRAMTSSLGTRVSYRDRAQGTCAVLEFEP
ncbi:sensor histidine kinase [Alsobacter sp. R-9]